MGVAPFTYDPFTYHPFYLPVVGKRVADHHHHYRHVSFIFSARPGHLSPIDWIETILKFRAIIDHLTSVLALFKKIGNIIFTVTKIWKEKNCFSGLPSLIKFPFFVSSAEVAQEDASI